jgi:hypothetical protein
MIFALKSTKARYLPNCQNFFPLLPGILIRQELCHPLGCNLCKLKYTVLINFFVIAGLKKSVATNAGNANTAKTEQICRYLRSPTLSGNGVPDEEPEQGSGRDFRLF